MPSALSNIAAGQASSTARWAGGLWLCSCGEGRRADHPGGAFAVRAQVDLLLTGSVHIPNSRPPKYICSCWPGVFVNPSARLWVPGAGVCCGAIPVSCRMSSEISACLFECP
eukprot:6387395-Pyramimonas_sp.AAC.1